MAKSLLTRLLTVCFYRTAVPRHSKKYLYETVFPDDVSMCRTIISVPFYEWEGLHVRSKQKAYLAKLLWDAGWHGPTEPPEAPSHQSGSRDESSHARLDTLSVETSSGDSRIRMDTGVEKVQAQKVEDVVVPVSRDSDLTGSSPKGNSSNEAELPNSVDPDSVRQAAMLSLLEKRGGKPRSKLERLSRLSSLQNRTQR